MGGVVALGVFLVRRKWRATSEKIAGKSGLQVEGFLYSQACAVTHRRQSCSGASI